MPRTAILEYEDMVRLFFRFPALAGNLLEVEHGSTDNCHAGGCIAHTHIHLLPGLMKHHDFLNTRLRVAATLPNLGGIQNFNGPYILLRGNLGRITLFVANAVPTQTVRRILCERLGQANWDWRTEPRSGLIEETIDFWKTALAHV
jgi:hypothetical protein